MLDGLEAVELRDNGKTASGLHITVGDLEVQLYIADGAEAAQDIANRLASYTRLAPITRVEAYEDAKRRLEARRESDQSLLQQEPVLLIGSDVVTVQDLCIIRVGDLVKYRIAEVEEYAQYAANLPLPNGASLQAALALLVIPAKQRGDDVTLLSQRIAAYEARQATRIN